VHEYDELDHDRVYEGIATALRDIPLYVAAVEGYLRR
jgi:uncharacterized protein YutE (UPF0331/DUF86 family)